LFGLGKLILHQAALGTILLVIAAACAIALNANMGRSGWNSQEGTH
jgi:hypothetical protein